MHSKVCSFLRLEFSDIFISFEYTFVSWLMLHNTKKKLNAKQQKKKKRSHFSHENYGWNYSTSKYSKAQNTHFKNAFLL